MGSSAAEQAAMIQEINSLEKLRSVHSALRTEKARLIALTATLGTTNASTTAKITALSASLKVTEKRYDDLYKSQKNVNKESNTFETAAKGFQTLFGAGSNSVTNAVTNYAKQLSEAAFQTREIKDITGRTTREMTMFGYTLGGNAANLNKMTQAAIATATVVGTTIDVVNKASIAQGRMSGLYGAQALSRPGEYYSLQAEALKVGGSKVQEITKLVTSSALAGRKDLLDFMGGAPLKADQAEKGIRQLAALDVSGLPVADFLNLAANQMGYRSGKSVVGLGANIATEAYTKGISTEQYARMIMGIANNFAQLGLSLEDAHVAVLGFSEELKSGTMTAPVINNVLSQGIQAQQTAGGAGDQFMTALGLRKNFSKMDETTQKRLTEALGGDPRSMDMLTLAGKLVDISPELYQRSKEGSFLMAQTLGRNNPLLEKITTEQMTGLTRGAAGQLFGLRASPEEAGQVATVTQEQLANFSEFMSKSVDQSKEWTAGIKAFLEELKAFITNIFSSDIPSVSRSQYGDDYTSVRRQVMQGRIQRGAGVGLSDEGAIAREMDSVYQTTKGISTDRGLFDVDLSIRYKGDTTVQPIPAHDTTASGK